MTFLDPNILEIEYALKTGLYYLAVSSSLALPDVCAALEYPDGKAKPERYQDWYDIWLAPKYQMISRDDIYCLRCGVLHTGSFGHKVLQYERVIFVIPGMGSNIHKMTSDRDGGTDYKLLILNPVTFCRDVIESVISWRTNKQNDPIVQANIPRLVQFRPEGFPPGIVGRAVIA